MSASAVISALRARLEAAGHTVVVLRTIDADLDALPVVGVYFGQAGEATELHEYAPTARRALEVDVVLVQDAVGEDPEVEAIVAAEALRDVLVQHGPDRLDDLDASCDWATDVALSVETRTETTDAIVSSVRIRAHY